MKIPCAKRLGFVVSGLSFLQPALTNVQMYDFTLVATALILGSRLHLTEISCMLLKEKAVSTLSYLFSDAKICTDELQMLYLLQTLNTYKISHGYFIIDDTMKHHTKFCKWIHGVFILFDHALGTNLKATCIVFLCDCITKYDLAIEMMEWAISKGFPECIVLADSWFGISPFIRELNRLDLDYVLEIKANLKIRESCKEPKLTPKGRLAKYQYDLVGLAQYFGKITTFVRCGFPADPETGRKEKALYITKASTVRLNAIPGKHRIVESHDPATQTIKYLLTNRLAWEPTKIISVYSHRWVIEEFFKNAKQLSDMEGATLRSEQGATLALYLVSWIDFLLHLENYKQCTWIDFLLHLENYKQCTTGKLTKEPLTIPSIVRRAQNENLEAFVLRVQSDEDFVNKLVEFSRANMNRNRKKYKELVVINGDVAAPMKKAA
jgi:hypothetical protein